jgi:hypothetical protein
MPRAAHGVIDDDAVGERPVIVRAVRADREELAASPHEQHVFIVNAPEHDATVLKRADGDALPKIRALFFGIRGHVNNLVALSHHDTPKALFNTGITASFVDRRNQYVVTRDGERFLVTISVEDENSAPITVIVNWDPMLKK